MSELKQIFKVPRCFVEEDNQDENCNSDFLLLNSLGHYCMKNENCRKIVHFLTLSGKHNVVANTEILYQDTISSFGDIHVKTFDEIVDQVLYKIFEKRFENKNDYMKNTTFISVFGYEDISRKPSYKRIQKVNSILPETDCHNDGPDCVAAILILDNVLNRLYRILTVLNKGTLENNRNYGTLMVNVISELNPNARNGLNEKKEMMVGFSKLEVELKNLLRHIIPESDLPLTNFFELLGY